MAERAAIPRPRPSKGAGQIAVTGPPPPPHRAHALAAHRFGPKGSLDGRQPPNIFRLTSSPIDCRFAAEGVGYFGLPPDGCQASLAPGRSPIAGAEPRFFGESLAGPGADTRPAALEPSTVFVRPTLRRDGEQRNHKRLERPPRWQNHASFAAPAAESAPRHFAREPVCRLASGRLARSPSVGCGGGAPRSRRGSRARSPRA